MTICELHVDAKRFSPSVRNELSFHSFMCCDSRLKRLVKWAAQNGEIMAAPITQEVIELYVDVLSEIKYRTEYATSKLAKVSDVIEFDSATLQLRKSIELIALGTLVANRQAVAEVTSSLHEKDWNDARKLLRSFNRNYWPTPFKDGIDANGRRSLEALTDPYLTEGEAGRAWSFLSESLHANNPFAPKEIDQQRADRTRDIALRLRNLLGLHTAELGNRDHVILAQMDTPPDGNVLVIVLDEILRESRSVEG